MRPATRESANGEALRREDVPLLPFATFRDVTVRSVAGGARLLALTGLPREGGLQLLALLGDPEEHRFHWLATEVGGSFPSLAPDLPAAHRFERELAEQWGVVPEGHPWLKPVRFPASPVGVMNYYRVEGEEVHEVAVGPVHAGVIEPGHFRFQCLGEEVLHLEISLGYQHRGVQQALEGGPGPRTMALLETVAGDSSVAHALAGCRAMEGLAGAEVPEGAQRLRAAALELERLANHCGDLGALAGDVGYLPGASYFGRLRGDLLNLTQRVCGNRFGRGLVRPGGVAFDLDEARRRDFLDGLEAAMRDASGAARLLWRSSSTKARFEETGVVQAEDARALGLSGPSARACGLATDARREYPVPPFEPGFVPTTADTGDVDARARVRWQEMEASADLVRRWLDRPVEAPLRAEVGRLRPGMAAASVVEGWRGMAVHLALTDGEGRFAAYRVVDPSFQNWDGLAMALRGTPISDFPLCNKSFNLSYCGHDL